MSWTRRIRRSKALEGFIGAFLCALVGAAQVWAEEGASSVWKVTDGRASVYLAGTIHLLREKDYPLPEVFQKAYTSSGRIFFEVDLRQINSAEGRRRAFELSFLPEGVNLKDRISKPLDDKLQAFFRERGLKGEQFARLNPAMMAMTVTAIEASRLGARAELGVEPFFDRQARKDGKPVLGLETADFQMRLFDQLTAAEQEELLLLTVDNLPDTGKDLADLIDAWRKGDAKALDEVLNRHVAGHERIQKVILYDRNRAWLPSIERVLKSESGDALFLVGVGHLVGKQGLLRLLEEQGYTVTQVRARNDE